MGLGCSIAMNVIMKIDVISMPNNIAPLGSSECAALAQASQYFSGGERQYIGVLTVSHLPILSLRYS
jgi:hypothetical protein